MPPVVGSPLEVCFSRPYTIKGKVGNLDYIVSTPERRRKNRLCHVNMIKPFYPSDNQEGLNKQAECTAGSSKHCIVRATQNLFQ